MRAVRGLLVNRGHAVVIENRSGAILIEDSEYSGGSGVTNSHRERCTSLYDGFIHHSGHLNDCTHIY